MKNELIPLGEKLGLARKWWNYEALEPLVESACALSPSANDSERAWVKFRLPFRRFLLSLGCYLSGNFTLAKNHSLKCLEESSEFFFGDWREKYKTPEGSADPHWWKRRFTWMQIFEASLLWGSVLGKWELLGQIGAFPERDSCISDERTAQERDLYVAMCRFLCQSSSQELAEYFNLAETGPSMSCKLLVKVMREALTRNTVQMQARLNDYLAYYFAEEFPKEELTVKISIHGSFFIHWAEKEGISMKVPLEYQDYIVKLP